MPGTDAGSPWVVSRRTGRRGLWGLAGVAVFGALAAAAVAAFVRAPHVDSGVMLVIAVTFLLAAVVLALEGLARGLVHVDAQGYRTPMGLRRAASDVLAVGTGQVEGDRVPVVAVRGTSGGPEQDVFTGFADQDSDRLVAALRERLHPVGLAGALPGEDYWARVEAEAERAASVVAAAGGRRPLSRDRVEFGYPGLATALRLDYGTNDAGEGVELVVRESTTLAVVAAGRRWFRQDRKRSADPASQVEWLFGPHTTTVEPSTGTGFDRLVVSVEGRRPLVFNAEEPDRF